MHKKIKVRLVAVLVLAAIGTALFFLIPSRQSLSDEDILRKFECDRITLEIRETDIFCSKPELYRNPWLSEDEYTAWQFEGCDERLKNPLSNEQRARDGAMAYAYDRCLNKPNLHDEYTKFLEDTKELKKKY